MARLGILRRDRLRGDQSHAWLGRRQVDGREGRQEMTRLVLVACLGLVLTAVCDHSRTRRVSCLALSSPQTPLPLRSAGSLSRSRATRCRSDDLQSPTMTADFRSRKCRPDDSRCLRTKPGYLAATYGASRPGQPERRWRSPMVSESPTFEFRSCAAASSVARFETRTGGPFRRYCFSRASRRARKAGVGAGHGGVRRPRRLSRLRTQRRAVPPDRDRHQPHGSRRPADAACGRGCWRRWSVVTELARRLRRALACGPRQASRLRPCSTQACSIRLSRSTSRLRRATRSPPTSTMRRGRFVRIDGTISGPPDSLQGASVSIRRADDELPAAPVPLLYSSPKPDGHSRSAAPSLGATWFERM